MASPKRPEKRSYTIRSFTEKQAAREEIRRYCEEIAMPISVAPAAKLDRLVRRHPREEELREARQRPCPVRVRYEEAARDQHAVIWGLSTGIIRDVVRTYRRERRDCSTHGSPNWKAADVIPAAAPSIGRDRAREMVDAMLAWTIARHGTWFWTGLQGDRIINPAIECGARSGAPGVGVVG